DHYDHIVEGLRSRGIPLEKKVLSDCLGAYVVGRDWVLRKFKFPEHPRMIIGINANPDILGACIGVDENGEDVIFIPQEMFRLLIGSDKETVVEKPITKKNSEEVICKYTLEQLFEQIGIEETTHWLAKKGTIEGLTPINDATPKVIAKDNAEEYIAQPHELEALRLYHAYFCEKYGTSPVKQLVDLAKL
ncbi:MAG: hypothetical protein ACMG6E_00660, partial [Candidatus Roizmanbacteria bacterium]